MDFSQNKNLLRWLLIIAAFLVVALILWNTNVFFQKFKQEERTKMEIIAIALENMNNPDLDIDIALEGKIIESNKNIPMILTDSIGKIQGWNNLNFERETDIDELSIEKRIYLNKQLELMKSENKPLIIKQYNSSNIFGYIYYRDSDILNKLQYYPLALVLILFLFGSVIYLVFKSSKSAEQNKLWAGMAKETAHQIGTPLSSLMGWLEILRLENVDETTILEIQKDVDRLNIIAERFSKIGSVPSLTKHNIVEETKRAFDYYKSRSSKSVTFSFITENDTFFSMINPQLYSWVIENLVKNAIDAMQGKGSIKLKITSKDNKHIKISVTDSGKGIPKSLYKKIFVPGFTTKKRGWGLGLSLTKRIVQDYHNGKIYVEKSEVGKGTTFSIFLDKVTA